MSLTAQQPQVDGGGADHPGTAQPGELDRHVTDPAGRAVDENGLPRLQPGLLEERLPRRENYVRQSRGVNVIE
jgi:hypothetical protein